MARISGVNIPNDKRIEIALTYIYGIGPKRSKKILDSAKINPDTRAKDISEADLEKIRNTINQSFQVEGDLRMEVSQNIKRLKEIGSYRGGRHTKGLPVRGQRTKTNARTKKGKKVTVGSGRKPSAQKT